MRGVLCNAFDAIKALTIGEAEEPRPRADEVLIDVHAASVSYMDYLMARGGYQMRPPLPYVPGTDAAGIVVAVGEDHCGVRMDFAAFQPRHAMVHASRQFADFRV